MATKTVLAVRFSALGDVALSLPALYDACMSNPDTQFVLLTRGRAASIFINAPENLTVEAPDLSHYPGLNGMRRLASELYAKYHPDAFVDLHDVLRTKALRFFFLLKGTKTFCINKDRAKKKALTRKRKKMLLPLLPTIERYRLTLRNAGVDLRGKFDTLFPPEGGNPELFASVTPPKKEGEYWLAVAPFAQHAGKIYPPELTEEVVAHFAARPDTKIFLFGFGEEEEKIVGEWARKYPSAIDMGKHSIGPGAEMALLSHCDTMFSMDSANMHLASLAGLRTVSVWGATHPYCGFMGWRQKESDCVQLDMVCRPCSVFGNKPCRHHDYHCLRGISPNLIIQRIENPE